MAEGAHSLKGVAHDRRYGHVRTRPDPGVKDTLVLHVVAATRSSPASTQLRETTKLDGLYQPASAVDAGVESPVSFPVVVKDGLTRGEKGLPPLKTLALRVALVGHVALVPSLEIAHVHTGLAFGHIAHLRNRPQASEATVSDLHRMGQGATGAFGCLQRSRQTY